MDLTRRDFVAATAVTVAGACCCGTSAADAATVEALADAPAAPPTSAPSAGDVIDAGPATAIAKGVSDKLATKPKGAILLVRDGDEVHASSSLCTHKFCVVQKRDSDLYCKCHKSSFSDDGKVTHGPAKTALPRYGVSIDEKGHLIVDKTKKFDEAKWSDAGASVKIA